MGFAPVTIEGRLGAEPELRFLPNGAAVTDLRVAHTERKRDGENWVDGATLWFRVTVWRKAAENVAESLHKGDLIIVHGDLTEETFTNREGVEQAVKKITAKWIGPSLSTNTATVNRAQRQQGQQQQGDQWQQPGGWNPNAGQQQRQPQDDPWAQSQQQYDEPPF